MNERYIKFVKELRVKELLDYGEVKNINLADAVVTAEKIGEGAVEEIAIADGSITTEKLANGGVTAAKVAAEAITSDKIAQAAITASKIGDAYKILEIVDTLPSPGSAGRIVFLMTDKKIYRDNGTEWKQLIMPSEVTAHLGGEGVGTIGAVKIDNGAIEEAKLATGAVSAAKIAAGAVTTLKLDALAVTAEKIAANAVVAGKIAANAVDTGQLVAGAVTADILAANAVISDKIAANAVTAVKIAAGTITADKIAVGILGSGNELNNGNFEDWTAGTTVAPDAWTLYGAGAVVMRTTNHKLNTYAASLSRIGADCHIYQAIHAEKGITYWQGRTVTFSCWVWASVANRAEIGITDGVGGTYSSYHTGSSTWELLTVSRTVDAGATGVFLVCLVLNGDTSAAFDGAMCVEGSYALPYADKIKNFGHPSNYTLIDGGKIYTGTIVVAGLGSAVTDRMFVDGTTKTNIEAWRHASDVTLIDGGDIYTGSVTATQISVASLSAIQANMGTLTAGKIAVGSIEINADTERILMGAASGPVTGTGIFIGKDGADYEFRCGNPSGHAIHWDGSELNIYKDGSSEINATELQEGAARARMYITWDGIFAGGLWVGSTGVKTGGVLYELKKYSAGGTVWYLGFDTAVPGGGGGTGESCFTAKTKILMAIGKSKHIVDVQVGDYILTRKSELCSKLVKAKVLKVYEHEEVDTYFLINDLLEVTHNHRMFINGTWQRVESIKIGDEFIDHKNRKVVVKSIRRIKGGKEKVYNLEIEEYRTYFAEGLYVHNAKSPS